MKPVIRVKEKAEVWLLFLKLAEDGNNRAELLPARLGLKLNCFNDDSSEYGSSR